LFSKIFGAQDSQKSSDPIINRCLSFANQFQISLTEEEWNHVLRNRDKLVESPLGGAYVHKDILNALYFLCLFDGLFESGFEFLRINDIRKAKASLEKAKRLLPWPTALYSLGLVYVRSGEVDAATKIWNKAIETFESRSSLLSVVVPDTLPQRNNFIAMATERIDTTGSANLGFSNIEEFKVNISKRIEELRNRRIS